MLCTRYLIIVNGLRRNVCPARAQRATFVPSPPCISYANVRNYYGPYAHCCLDMGVACVQHIQLPTHTCACAWYECTLTSAHFPNACKHKKTLGTWKFQVHTHVGTSNEGCEPYKCLAWKPFLRSYTMQNNCTCSPLEDAFG